MTATTSMINITLDHVADTLEQYLIDEVVDPDDVDTIAQTVRCGRLQADPTGGTGITILLHPNHPSDDNWRHRLARAEEIGIGVSQGELPIFELGTGGHHWLRRYTVTLTFFDLGETERSFSRTIAGVVLSRAEHALRNNLSLSSLGQDSFGESAYRPITVDSFMRERGGPGAYAWKGEIKFQTLNWVQGAF